MPWPLSITANWVGFFPDVGVRLDRVVDQLRDRVAVAAVAKIANAADEGLGDHQSEP